MEIALRLPLRDINLNQDFAKNYLNFYQQWGLKGHNGTDFQAFHGFDCYASHGGVITVAGVQSDGGIEVEIWNKIWNIKTLYYHLENVTVKVGQTVIAGDIIGHCDNTGKYTTGDHLHFGFKFVDINGNTLNKDNGYNGAVDPRPYFKKAYNGFLIANKDCYAGNVRHRYLKDRTWTTFLQEKKVAASLTKQLKRIPTSDQISACTYGGWGAQDVDNIALYQLWGYMTKDEYNKGRKAFQN